MNKVILLAFLAAPLAACQTTSFQPPSDSSSYVRKSAFYQKIYMNCLITKGIAEHGRRLSSTINKNKVKSECAASGSEYYKAAYANAWLGDSYGNSRRKTVTAQDTLKAVEDLVFSRLSSTWNQVAKGSQSQ